LIEFGVAFGETTEYLTSRIKERFVYHGFDTFESLPLAWRRLPAGAMSNDGKVPTIPGEHIFFHKGLIKDTINQVNFRSPLMKIFIFDFDLYEPTLFALKYVSSDINVGDIVYFVEAFDCNERLIVKDYFLDKFHVEVIGATPFGLAFEIKKSMV
jgi:intein/homing endonuclease